MPSSKPRTHSKTFLSGEADQVAQSRREERLGGILAGPSSSSSASSSGIIDGFNHHHGRSEARPRIQVVSETRNESSDDSDDDDGPPPLSLGTPSSAKTENQNAVKATATNAQSADAPSLMEEMLAEAAKVQKVKEASTKAKERKDAKKASFGMKKGFLNSSSKSKKSKKKKKSSSAGDGTRSVSAATKNADSEDGVYEIDSEGNLVKTSSTSSPDDIPTIRPKSSRSPASEADRLRLQEVQEAMKNSSLERLAGSSDEWANDDLMEKVANNPRLAAGMRNPKFAAALEALQKDPKGALERFKDHPEIIIFLREFCGVMGQHFTKLGEEQERTAAQKKGTGTPHNMGPLAEKAIKKQAEREAKGSSNTVDQMSKEEKESFDRIMSNPELTEILMDPNMQRIMQECEMPGRMRMYMQHEEYGPKLQKLFQAGLLKLA